MRTVRLRVPGKVMLAGEYTVLQGGHCLACTTEPYLEIQATTQVGYELRSTLWKTPQVFTASALSRGGEPFSQAVAKAESLWQLGGALIEVRSQLDIQAGLGSSSALQGGVLMALSLLQTKIPSLSASDLIVAVTALQHARQGAASGYDIFTQVHGGLLFMVPQTGEAESLPVDTTHFSRFFHLWGGGKGAPTTPTLLDTQTWLNQEGRGKRLREQADSLLPRLKAFCLDPHACSDSSIWEALGRYRDCLGGSPHFPQTIHRELSTLPGFDQTWSYKPTGAGGEDALWLLGTEAALSHPIAVLQQEGWYSLPGKTCVPGMERYDSERSTWCPLFAI